MGFAACKHKNGTHWEKTKKNGARESRLFLNWSKWQHGLSIALGANLSRYFSAPFRNQRKEACVLIFENRPKSGKLEKTGEFRKRRNFVYLLIPEGCGDIRFKYAPSLFLRSILEAQEESLLVAILNWFHNIWPE